MKIMRDPNRIDEFCDELKVIWHQVPDWRFGQLIDNLLSAWNSDKDAFYAEDELFLPFMKDYINQIKNN